MNKVVDCLKNYFHENKIRIKDLQIIKLEINDNDNYLEINIHLKTIGRLIGKNGWRIKDIEKYFFQKTKKETKIKAIQHIEWYKQK